MRADSELEAFKFFFLLFIFFFFLLYFLSFFHVGNFENQNDMVYKYSSFHLANSFPSEEFYSNRKLLMFTCQDFNFKVFILQ